MDNSFDPWASVRAGQQAQQSLAEAQLQGMSLRERLALKKAAGAMGSQNYFAGFEGVPGAERPDYLKEAYQNVSPEDAMKLEDYASQKFKLERGAIIAGQTEAAKQTAKFGVLEPLMERQRSKMQGLIPQNAMGGILEGGTASSQGQDLSGLSGVKEKMGITPQGFDWSMESMPSIQQQQIMDEIVSKRAATTQARDKYNQDDIQNAVSNVRASQQAFREAQIAESKDPEAKNLVDLAYQQWRMDKQRLAEIQRNQTVSTRTAAPEEQADALIGYDPHGELTGPSSSAPSVMPSRSSAPAASSMSRPSAPGVGSLSRERQQDVSQKAIDEKRVIANKAIEVANDAATKARTHAPAVAEMMRLVTKEQLGNRAIGNLPGGETVLRMTSENNNRLVTFRNQLIDEVKKEGETRSFDTLPELKIISSMIPDLSAGPSTNALSMAAYANLSDARSQASDLLEQWARTHEGGIDGARTVLRDWMRDSPRYLTKTKHGRVTIEDNPTYVPLLDYQQSARGSAQKERTIGKDTYRKQRDGSWLKQ